ncbi:hypothetical protein RKE25_22900 (plasmid) [Dyella sp. BiH032]|uniref:hypothetical protein n=1 Tax=Dyella sp. BiH032 TaxID=3075430 RepID=UPI0028931553|nr:hypothetical protein [Dyella sp. BiH032]WNL48385.1 hypothetical protein RKE25_22900 [Dyella sp. BiH032]
MDQRLTSAAIHHTKEKLMAGISKKFGQGLAGLAIGLVVLGAFVGKDDNHRGSEDAPMPKVAPSPYAKLEKLHKVISVRPLDSATKQVTIAIRQDSIFSGGNQAKDVLEHARKDLADVPYDTIAVQMVEQLVDKYGREFEKPILQLTYARADVEAINYDRVIGWNVLNVAKVTSLDPISGHIVDQECFGDDGMARDNLKYAREFCLKARLAPPDA